MNTLVTKYTEIKKEDKILRKAMYNIYDGKDFYTGRNLSFNEINIDHINPTCNEGKNCINNYVLCSSYINLKKHGKYNDEFIKVVTQINQLLFVDNVVNEYNNFLLNENIKIDIIEINFYLEKNNITNEKEKNRLKQLFRRRLKVVKIVKNGQTKPKLYYNIKQIERLSIQHTTEMCLRQTIY